MDSPLQPKATRRLLEHQRGYPGALAERGAWTQVPEALRPGDLQLGRHRGLRGIVPADRRGPSHRHMCDSFEAAAYPASNQSRSIAGSICCHWARQHDYAVASMQHDGQRQLPVPEQRRLHVGRRHGEAECLATHAVPGAPA